MQLPPELARNLKEIAKQSSSDEEEILRLGTIFEEFVKQPGWVLLAAIASKQQENHMSNLLNVQSTRDADQFIKGLIFGQKLLLATPALTMEHRKDILQQRKKASEMSEELKEGVE